MIILQPLYVGADRGRTGFDAAVIALDNGLGGGDLAGGVVEIADDIVMQRTLVALQRQSVVATPIDDLLGDLALAVERVDGHDRAPGLRRGRLFSESISNSLGTAVISLDLASVAICASTRRCSHPQALTMCSADLPLARSNERRSTLPPAFARPSPGQAVDSDNALDGFGEPCHEPLEHGTELLRVKQAEQAAEGVVAGQAILELEEATQERLLRHGERRHVRGALTAAQNGAQGDHQQFVQVVQTSIAGPRILQSFKAGNKLVQLGLRRLRYAGGRVHRLRIGQAPIRMSRKFQVRFPC